MTLRVGRRGGGEEEEDKAKTLPVCFRFLLGSCFDEHCPYPHVNVNPLAAVCEDFLAGYCPQGSACKLLHTYECQTWVRTGECDDTQCRFKHPRNVRGRRRLAEPPVPVAGSSALSSLPSLTSSDVIDQPRADNGEEEEEEEDEASRDDGRGRFRAQDDEEEDEHQAEDGEDDEEDDNNSSASYDDHEAQTKRRKLSALPDVLSGSIVPKFG